MVLLEFAVKMYSEPYSNVNCGAAVQKRLERDFEAKYGTFSMDLVVFIDPNVVAYFSSF